jgi:hypothetical protein
VTNREGIAWAANIRMEPTRSRVPAEHDVVVTESGLPSASGQDE